MAIDRSYIAENDRKRRRLEAPTVQGRARSSDRIPKLVASAALGLATALGPTAAVEAQSSPAVTVTISGSAAVHSGTTFTTRPLESRPWTLASTVPTVPSWAPLV